MDRRVWALEAREGGCYVAHVSEATFPGTQARRKCGGDVQKHALLMWNARGIEGIRDDLPVSTRLVVCEKCDG